MRKNNGWVKLYRQILCNPIVMKSSAHFSVWCLLMLMANNKSQKALFKGEVIELKPGQLITGRKEIKNALKDLSESKIERVLNDFEAEQQIEQQKSNKGRLIFLLNWNTYQKSEQQSEQQVNNGFRGLTSVHSRETLKSEQQSEQQNCSKYVINTRGNEVEFEEVNSTLNNNRTTSEQQVNNNRTLNKNIKNNKNIKKVENSKSTRTRETDTHNETDFDIQGVVDLYNTICVSLPKVKVVTSTIKESVVDVQKRFIGIDFKVLFEQVEKSDFLTGRKTGWKGCNLNWILIPTNTAKVLNGEYDDFKKKEEIRSASYSLADFDNKSLFTD